MKSWGSSFLHEQSCSGGGGGGRRGGGGESTGAPPVCIPGHSNHLYHGFNFCTVKAPSLDTFIHTCSFPLSGT